MPKEKNSCTPASVGVFFAFFYLFQSLKLWRNRNHFRVYQTPKGFPQTPKGCLNIYIE
jgi:hypothetical protein